MERSQRIEPVEDGHDWAERSDFWLRHEPKRRGRAPKYKYREPLILCGHGVRLKVDHGTLLIRTGFTHYPQKADEIRFFPGDPNLPDRIVMVDGSGGISFDALSWMTEQQITLVQLDWRGQVSFVGGNSGYAGNSKLVECQSEVRGTPRGVEICRWLIREKIGASVDTLSAVAPDSENTKATIAKLTKWKSDLNDARKVRSISKIHGVEGGAASLYFQAWQGIPLNWSGPKKKPIPDSWHEIGPRSMTWRKSGQNARHPINAMLNYGYAVLISQMQTEVLAAGLDPSVALMHGTSQNRIPLVYDLMEPLRPVIDRGIIEFACAHKFSHADFAINRFGGCRLNPQLARVMVKHLQGRCDAKPIVQKFITLLK